ncbi:MAG: outer membrane protein assembly factor BamB [gamma proteobacterium symbiont of Bathyaustriella thionipta]|nr:outer membrane protein assembly factor BamB [gamma proteobacterium symbiont of Bathyaustriella thionipta]
MMWRNLPLLLLLASLLAGCGVTDYFRGSENIDPPAELQDLDDPYEVEELWSDSVGEGTDSQRISLYPAYRSGFLVVAEHEGDVVAFDPDNGDHIWEVELDLPISGGPGLGESLAVVGTLDGEVIALDLDTGEEQWRTHVSSEVLSVPAVGYGVVVVRSVDGRVTGLSEQSGEQLWTYTRKIPALSLRGSASPVISGDQVIIGLSNGKLAALDLQTGNPRWEVTVAIASGRSDLERIVDIDSQPISVDDVIYAVSFQGQMAAISEGVGVVLWRREFSSSAGLAADWRRIFAIDSDSNVWGLDPANGASIWKQNELYHRKLAQPVIVGEYLVVADFEGYVHWLDQDSGRIVAREEVDSDGISGVMAVNGDILYVYGNSGDLAALRLKLPAEPEE